MPSCTVHLPSSFWHSHAAQGERTMGSNNIGNSNFRLLRSCPRCKTTPERWAFANSQEFFGSNGASGSSQRNSFAHRTMHSGLTTQLEGLEERHFSPASPIGSLHHNGPRHLRMKNGLACFAEVEHDGWQNWCTAHHLYCLLILHKFVSYQGLCLGSLFINSENTQSTKNSLRFMGPFLSLTGPSISSSVRGTSSRACLQLHLNSTLKSHLPPPKVLGAVSGRTCEL